eukprot:COSAG03_NODE_13321_length_507_cov_1.026961_1_plen_123_part_00
MPLTEYNATPNTRIALTLWIRASGSCRNRRLAPLGSDGSSSSLSLAEGDFNYHERYAKSAAKLRRDRGQRRGTMSFIDDLLQARDDEQWILANPEKWMQIKQERGGPSPDALEDAGWDGRIR